MSLTKVVLLLNKTVFERESIYCRVTLTLLCNSGDHPFCFQFTITTVLSKLT